MAAKIIVCMCLVGVALGSFLDDLDCEDATEMQALDTTSCVLETATVDAIRGHCPKDTIIEGPLSCKNVEVEFCRTFPFIGERCWTRTCPRCACTKTYRVHTSIAGRVTTATCETEQGTCEDTTVQGVKKQKCNI